MSDLLIIIQSTRTAAWVGGGYDNLAEGKFSAVFGGKELTAKMGIRTSPIMRRAAQRGRTVLMGDYLTP
jgi:hypothetical protein